LTGSADFDRALTKSANIDGHVVNVDGRDTEVKSASALSHRRNAFDANDLIEADALENQE